MKVVLRFTGTALFTGTILLIAGCLKESSDGPYFGNGFHNGWADHTSIVIWTRLTSQPEGNAEGAEFIKVNLEEARKLSRGSDVDLMLNSQLPRGLSLEDMRGACPGTTGEVQFSWYPAGNPGKKHETPWTEVDLGKNYTTQWKLDGLAPDTRYVVEIRARKANGFKVSDVIEGGFCTPPLPETVAPIEFCVVTCHDYPRIDSTAGHKIYNAMSEIKPDFYVHTGDIEYYDKPDPWAMTEELMRFKWDRLFALPLQRNFWNHHTTYFQKDDHDVLMNDVFPGMSYGPVSFERGLEIFDREQFPSNDKPFKTIRWGRDLQIWLLEGRNYRSRNSDPDGPDKTIWGKEQKAWFFRTVNESDATFKVLISPTPVLGPDRAKGKNDNHSNLSFKTEGDEIRDFINGIENMYICNGDRHWQYVTHWEGTNLWEFGCGAGSDSHAGGWKQDDLRPEHRFLRVKGGFLHVSVNRIEGQAVIDFHHKDVDGNVVHLEQFIAEAEGRQ